MNRALLAASILLVGSISGCSDAPEKGMPDGTSTPSPIPTPLNGTGPPIVVPTGQAAWQLNETLSSVDCTATTLGVVGADKAWIQQQLPEGMTVPGSAPEVNVVISQCASQALGNRSVTMATATLLAYVDVDRADANGSRPVSFPLEFSTSNALAGASLQGWGIYSENVSVTLAPSIVGSTLQVTGTTDNYQVTFGPPHPTQTQVPPLELRLWGDSEASLQYEMTREGDRAPSACTVTFQSGRLAGAFPQPAPCLFSRMTAAETIRPEIIR